MKYTSIILTGVLLLLITSCDKNDFQPLENNEPMFIGVSKTDPEMNQSFLDAKNSLDEFNELLLQPEHTNSFKMIKMRLLDKEHSEETGEDEFVYLWVSNIKRDGDEYLGYIFELPKIGINDLTPDQWLRFDDSFIYDWMIQNDEGHVWGGYSIRVLRSKQPKDQRANFDEYQGITEYK